MGADLDLLERHEIPVREVSALAVTGTPGGGTLLAAIGDAGPELAVAPVDAGGELGPWETVNLDAFERAADVPRIRQSEALAFDGAGTAVVLLEQPALAVLIDTRARRLAGTFGLDGSGLPGRVGERWSADPSSRGEGVLLLRGGRVLVAKEKRPAGLIEFGPAGAAAGGIGPDTILGAGEAWEAPAPGAALAALAWWEGPDGLDDLSDLAAAPDGSVHALSDQSRSLGRLALPLGPEAASAPATAIWALPKKVGKAEGLAFLPGGRIAIAGDRQDPGPNLAILAAPPGP
ncbi:MAG: hypothetical protein U0R70_02490 [Solirubrobacteraceae bacterium]